MQRSTQRLLTTHVGSLPRPRPLTNLLIRQERGETIDEGEFARQVEAATKLVIHKQLTAGIDIGNDGELSRPSFATYVAQRMTGFGGAGTRPRCVTRSSSLISRRSGKPAWRKWG